jgi:hypothetical protein
MSKEEIKKEKVKSKRDKREENKQKYTNRKYRCQSGAIYAAPPRLTFNLTTPATLLPHSQQQVTTKIKDFLRNSLSQHNKFCDRRTIVEHTALIFNF